MVHRVVLRVCLAACFALTAGAAWAEPTVNLWPGTAPGSEGWSQKEQVVPNTPIGTVALDVVAPTLELFLPEKSKATGVGVIVAPGGFCVALALSAEGTDVARWLQSRGIAAFVLKYRLQEKQGVGIPKDLDMDKACRYGIADGVQAVKSVRQHAVEWGVAPGKLGFMGFSAGGMVASGVLLQPDAEARPDFAALLYGATFGVMPTIPAKLPPNLHGLGPGRPARRPRRGRLLSEAHGGGGCARGPCLQPRRPRLRHEATGHYQRPLAGRVLLLVTGARLYPEGLGHRRAPVAP